MNTFEIGNVGQNFERKRTKNHCGTAARIND
jgi:hypothetical protein